MLAGLSGMNIEGFMYGESSWPKSAVVTCLLAARSWSRWRLHTLVLRLHGKGTLAIYGFRSPGGFRFRLEVQSTRQFIGVGARLPRYEMQRTLYARGRSRRMRCRGRCRFGRCRVRGDVVVITIHLDVVSPTTPREDNLTRDRTIFCQ